MKGDVRVLLIALFYDLILFFISLISFLYVRRVRGDTVAKESFTLNVDFDTHSRTVPPTNKSVFALDLLSSTLNDSKTVLQLSNDLSLEREGQIIEENQPEQELHYREKKDIGLFVSDSIQNDTSIPYHTMQSTCNDVCVYHDLNIFYDDFQHSMSRTKSSRTDNHSTQNGMWSSEVPGYMMATDPLIERHPVPLTSSASFPCLLHPAKLSNLSDDDSPGNTNNSIPFQECQQQEQLFDWLWQLLNIEDELFKSMDIQFYLLFLKTAQRMVAIIIVLPVNLTGNILSNESCDWLDNAAAGNITRHDWRIWILISCTWVYSLITYFYIYKFWNTITTWNSGLKVVRNFSPEDFTIMVKGLSSSPIDSSKLYRHFDHLFPNKVITVSLIMDYSELVNTKRALELAQTTNKVHTLETQSNSQINPTGVSKNVTSFALDDEDHPNEARELNPFICFLNTNSHHLSDTISVNPKNDSLHDIHPETTSYHFIPRTTLSLNREPMLQPFMQDNLTTHLSTTSFELQLPDRDQLEPQKQNNNTLLLLQEYLISNADIGFVLFRQKTCVLQCLQDPRSVGMNQSWQISSAPPPQDILWRNIHITDIQRQCRQIIFNLLLLMASLILTSSAILTNALIPLAENLVRAWNDVNFLKLSVTGWFAPLMLFFINAICLPQLIDWTAELTNYWRVSERDLAILHGHVIFLVLNTVILPTVGNGSIGALINKMYNTDIERWNITLGQLMVGQSGSFALRYILNGSFLSSAAQLSQIAQLSYFGLLQTFGRHVDQWQFDFGYSYAFGLSIFFMMLTFGIVVPIIVPFTMLFFSLKYYIDKYNFSFGIWSAQHESNGAVAIIAIRYMLGAVALFQFAMSGYFVTYGMRAIPNKSVSDKLLAPDNTISHIFTGRAVVLCGTLFFLMSLITTVLLLGHSTPFFQLAPEIITRDIGVQAFSQELTLAQEAELREAYIHPYQKEMEQYINNKLIKNRLLLNR